MYYIQFRPEKSRKRTYQNYIYTMYDIVIRNRLYVLCIFFFVNLYFIFVYSDCIIRHRELL